MRREGVQVAEHGGGVEELGDTAGLLSRTHGPRPPPDAGFCLELQPIKISGLLVYLHLFYF